MAATAPPMKTQADGSLDITEGFKYTKDNVLAYLDKFKDPNTQTEYRIKPQHIDPTLGTPLVKGDGIVAAVDKIAGLAAKDLTFEIVREDDIGLGFEGVELPVNTIYDALGWVMSVSWQGAEGCAAQKVGSTSKNYYLRLLALYARWCRILAPKDKNMMVHISWFTDMPKSESPRIILGSTIGKPTFDLILMTAAGTEDPTGATGELQKLDPEEKRAIAKATLITRERQHMLTEAGLQPARQNQLVQPNGEQGAGGFGLCAETFFFLYQAKKGSATALRPRVDVKDVKGFAMDPRTKHDGGDTKYNEKIAAICLAPPCDLSCQKLLKQIQADWDWKTSFGVNALRTDCGVPPHRDESDHSNSNTRPPATSAVANPGSAKAVKTPQTSTPKTTAPGSTADQGPQPGSSTGSNATAGQAIAGAVMGALTPAVQAHLPTIASGVVNLAANALKKSG